MKNGKRARTLRNVLTLFLCADESAPDPDRSGVSGGETAVSESPMVARWAVLVVGEPGVEYGDEDEEEYETVHDLSRSSELSKLLQRRGKTRWSVLMPCVRCPSGRRDLD